MLSSWPLPGSQVVFVRFVGLSKQSNNFVASLGMCRGCVLFSFILQAKGEVGYRVLKTCLLNDQRERKAVL